MVVTGWRGVKTPGMWPCSDGRRRPGVGGPTTLPAHTTVTTAAYLADCTGGSQHTNMACLCARGLTRKASCDRTSIIYNYSNTHKRLGRLHIVMVLLALQFLLTFAQGQGQGADEAARPPVDERVEFNIREGLPAGTEVGRINVRSGNRYKFSEEPSVFNLNPDTGRITTTIVLDRENLGVQEDKFDLFVSSTPSARHLIEVRINVLDVNDNSPRFGQPTIKVTFSERDQPGTQIILETATDKDVGLNDVIDQYYIITDSEDIRRKFRLVLLTDTSKPLLYLENLVQLDREEKSLYQLNISAQDGGSPPRFGYLLVNISVTDINDNPPLFDQSDYSASINETSQPGSSIVQVRATDQDAGDNGDITYRLINDDYEQFAIDSKTGVITTFKKLLCQQSCRPNDTPGSECNQKSCVVTVEASDSGQPPQVGRAYVTINLIDENDHDPVIRFDYPSGQSQKKYGMVNEGSKEDSIVAIVSVTDSDDGLNGQTTVRISRGNERGHFRLDSRGRFNFIKVAGKLDRERVSRYNLTLEARDLGIPQRTATSYIIIVVNDVNDHRPIFKQATYSARLSELVPVGSYVASITATDNDTGINAQITYTIISGDEFGWFHIDNSTGLVTTQAPLDHEQTNFIFLRIAAQDGGSTPFRSYTNLSVSIWDENDEVPTFPKSEYHLARSESEPANTEVVTLVASDNDQGRNGSVTYSLDPEVERLYAGTFSVGRTSGRVMAVRILDREEHAQYVLKVVASDDGRPKLSSTATLYINITDINDNAPVFYPVKYYASVLENQPAYTQVLQVRATDRDAGNNAMIHYRLVYAQNEDPKFSIDIKTGRITTTEQLDREQQAMYHLRVVAEDQGSPQREAAKQAEVEVTVNDVQDSAPEFSIPGGYSFTISEDDASAAPRLGRMVGQVTATTRDVSARISYAITSGDEYGVFTINSETGVIAVVRAVDREEASSYQLVIVASGAALHGQTTVNVTVADLNDNVPSFGRTTATAFVVENWPVGHEVYLADAVDPDANDYGRITYSLSASTQDAPLYKVNPTTGMIYLAESLKGVNGRDSFKVRVTATDAGRPPRSATLEVDIVLRDVNDHTPVFEQATYEVTVSESEQVNEHIYRISANDDDTGLNGELTYHISNNNAETPFGIFPDGVLYIAQPLDREVQDFYLLTIVVEDKGVEPRSSHVNVSIHIRDANDNQPIFSNYTYQMAVAENLPVGSYVGTVTATDADIGLNAEVSYKLEGTQENFEIHPTTGVIITKAIFDREALVKDGGLGVLSLVVIAMDGGERRLEEQAVVNVKVTDINDNTPKFVQDLYQPALYENTQPNTQVVRVSATDADEGDNGKITYSIIEGNKGGVFAISPSSGQVSLVGALDREATPEYTLLVMASDGGKPQPLNTTAIVRVSISDNNDNAPVFLRHPDVYDVIETTQVGTRVAKVRAVDADFGRNAQVSYLISGGNVGTTFHVDANTGKLYLAVGLDFELRRRYNLTLTATDHGTPRLSSQTNVAINVLDFNDNAPAFDSAPVVRQIEEGVQVGTSITVMRANDPDSGVNGDLRYSILRQEPPPSSSSSSGPASGLLFTIDPVTGRVTTAGNIDREAAPSYRLTVVAEDQALPVESRRTAEKVVTVVVKDLNDNAPQFVSMNAVAILLATPPDTKIATALAVDLDEKAAGQVQYELLSGDTSFFQIDSDNGDIYVRRDLGTQAKVFTLNIRAKDRGVDDALGAKSTDFRLSIFTKANVANGPSFTQSAYTGEVYENAAAGTRVLTVTAGDAATRVEYYVTGITSSGIDQARYFQVDPTSGVVSTTEVLDREKGFSDFEITVYAVERSSSTPRTRTTQVRIKLLDQNDSPPVFIPSEYEANVREDVTPGYNVINIIATDADEPGALLYEIVGGNDDGTFSIDATRGTLTLIKPLDREKQAEYNVFIEASDNVQSSRTRVRIHVEDVNDERPTFEKPAYAFTIPEDTRTGTTVGRVSALDSDLGKNGQVSYSLLSHWGRDKFSLSPNSGVLTVTGTLDYEEVHHYILVVQAADAGRPALSSTVSVYVNVGDVNDNTPVFDPGSYSDEVDEDAPVGTSILAVTATDVDSGANGRMAYSIVGGDKNGHFTMEADTGVIRTAKSLDRETQAYYTLAVMATDQAAAPSPRLSTTTMVSIILKDANDNAPEFAPLGPVTVLENLSPGTAVFTVSATDQDEGRNGYVEYRLTPASGDLFSLGPVDGVLRVNRKLDRETRDEYQIEVMATDKGVPPRSASTTMRVVVGDDNDNTPDFRPKEYQHEVAENVKVGTSLLTVTATDRDVGPNGDIRYVIVEGDENEDFRLDSHTGQLLTMKRLDYERKQKYTLKVKAEDQGTTPRSDVATIVVTVTDVNDNAPTFVDLPYVAYVQENIAQFPVHVLRITARDPDTGWGGRATYSIMNGDRSLFNINTTTGEIQALRPMDREQRAQYELTIRAVDSGSPRLSSTALVTVLVQDVNDQTPRFQHSRYAARIAEAEIPPKYIIRVSASDKDEGTNAKITYTLEDSMGERFGIHPASGQIYSQKLLNREDQDAYDLVVRATDSGLLSRSSSATVHVTVEDKNNNNPKFTRSLYTAYIRDPTTQGMFVMGVTAVDPDLGNNGHIVYSLMGGSDRNNFIIDSETGIITASRRLASADRTTRRYLLEVRATDKGQNPLSVDARVEVLLLSATLTGFPSLSAPQRAFRLSEMVSVGHVITTVRGTTTKPAVTLRYRIAGGNVDQSFAVTAAGEVKVNRALDYERTHNYNLWVEVYDDGENSLSEFLSLDVVVEDHNDNPPIFDKTFYEVTVTEEEHPPNSVIRVTATDADSGDNGRITYEIVRGNEEEAFDIDRSQGQIRTNRQLDRETRSNYSLEVRATDHGEPSFSAVTIVDITVADINDKPPVFTQHFQDTRIPENIPIGTSILKITSSDGDVGSNTLHSYSFTSNPGGRFDIEPYTGVVRVKARLDFETKSEYILQVSTNDGAHNADTPVTIRVTDVNDNAPRFSRTSYRFPLVAAATSGTLVGQVSATDADAAASPNSDVYFRFKKPTTDFRLDGDTGQIYSRRQVEYKEAAGSASPENVRRLVVVASDRGEPPMTREVPVVIIVQPANEQPPVFEKTTYTEAVPETAPLGYSIATLVAKDEQDDGSLGQVEYLETDGNGTTLFDINRSTGVVTVASSVSGHRGRTYFLQVTARDRGDPPRSSSVQVKIRVAEVNRNAPRFLGSNSAYEVTVPETTELQAVIATVSATDPDSGDNGLVSFFLTGGNPDGLFSVDESQGSIRVVKPLDYERNTTHVLNITARDRGALPNSVSRPFTVRVTDKNDNPPVFAFTEYDAYVRENAPSGTQVFVSSATDADTRENGVVQYSIIGSISAMNKFSMETGGIVTSQGSIDYELKQSYDVIIRAMNPGTALSSTTTVHVHVTGGNEYVPLFEQTEYQFVISESARPGDVVGVVHANDQDGGPDGEVFYYLIGDSNLSGFKINHKTGEVSIASQVDRESTAEIMLDILAKNTNAIQGNDTSTCRARVLIRDANDPPIFTSKVYRVTVPEDAQRGQSVVQVVASDSDLQSNFRDFTYTIETSGGRKVVPFGINPRTGLVTVDGKLDRETQPQYNITILATDSGTPPMTGSATVWVNLQDVNDNGPHFDPELPEGYVTENKAPYTEIIMTLSIYTKDADLRSSQGPFKYKLLDHTDKFEVGFTSALVKSKARLDRETNPEYLLTLEVSDNGNPSMTSTLTAKVIVTDQNDNPSAPRPLEVLVYGYNGSYPGGIIGDIRPLDPDTSGDWQCRISQGDLSVLNIQSACNLHSTKVLSGRQLNLNVSGSDGIHQSVDYSTKVKYLDFSHDTVDNSISIKVGVNKVEYFLASFYRKFESALQEALPSDTTPLLFGLSGLKEFTVLHVAARRASGQHLPRSQLTQSIQTNLDNIESRTGLVLESYNYNPCDDEPCANGAECSSSMVVGRYWSVDSASLILTAPQIKMAIRCNCRAGFTGDRCESPINKCDDSLCHNGGTCLSTSGTVTRCLCLVGWSGSTCDEDINECQQKQPCRNGGTCNNAPGSYSCTCVPQYAGKNCEYRNNFCASAPCQNGAQCISTSTGYECACAFGQRGARCEVSSTGFLPLSYMEYSLPWDRRRNSIIMEFATVKENALLLFGAGSSTNGKGEFIALEIIGGQVRFSFALGEGGVTRMTVPRRVNDGNWHRIKVNRNERVGILRVTDCPQGETVCRTCEDGDPACYVRDENSGLFSELQLTNDRISVGGVRSINLVLTNPGQVGAFDFVGCLRAASINDVNLMGMTPEAVDGIVDGCPRQKAVRCLPGVCQNDGVCVDEWNSHRCDCPAAFSGPDCAQAAVPFMFGPNAMVIYKQKEAFTRDQIFASRGLQRRRRRRQTLEEGHSVSVSFRTSHQEGLLFYSASSSDHTTIQVFEGQVLYQSESRGQTYKLPAPGDAKVSDSKWHNVTVTVKGTIVSLSLDDLSTTKAFASPVHDPLDLKMTELSLGGSNSRVTTPDGSSLIKGFEGCVSEFRLDGSSLPFSGSTDRFVAEPVGGTNNASCSAPLLGANGSDSVMHPAIIVVIVFFALVFIAIAATFLVIRKRRKNKEAADKAPKMNGSAVVSKTNGAILDKTSNDSRSHQDSGFTENGDLSEEAIIQQHVQRELASRSYSEREVVRDPFSASRPDLVSPEMGGVDGIGVDNNGYADEPPEHYDIDAASSIAPSDLVDVTGHYKRYRQSGGMGNKHQQYNVPPGQRGRHTPSPANVLGGGGKPYGIRDSPLTVGLHHHRQSPAVAMLSHKDNPNMHSSTPLGRGVSPLPVLPTSRQNTPNHMLGPSLPPVSPLNNLSRASPAVLDQRTTSPLSHNHLLRGQSPSVLAMRDKRMSPLPAGVNSMRSTPVNGLYPSNASNSSAGYSDRHNHHGMSNGHGARPSSRMKQPINQMAAMRATPTRGLTVEDVERLNARSKPSPVSTLDVGSSSSDEAPRKNLIGRARTPVSPFDPGRALQMEPPPDSSSDDGSNDSFTCSEFEYENDKVKNDYTPNRVIFPKLAEVSENDDTDVSRTFTPNGSDSNRDGSLSTFFSDDDAPKSGSKLLNGALNWDYLLNWGPNFEKLVGVFKDIAELPDGNSPQTEKRPTDLQQPQQQHDSTGVNVEYVSAEPTNAEVREEYV